MPMEACTCGEVYTATVLPMSTVTSLCRMHHPQHTQQMKATTNEGDNKHDAIHLCPRIITSKVLVRGPLMTGGDACTSAPFCCC